MPDAPLTRDDGTKMIVGAHLPPPQPRLAPIAERADQYLLSCFVTIETMPHIMKRITRLARSGRRMTVVRRYLGDDAAPEVRVGLLPDKNARSGGIHGWSQSNPEGIGVEVLCRPGLVSWGVAGYANDGDEIEARKRWHQEDGRQRRNVQHVEIQGGLDRSGGFGTKDSVTITRYNDDGVGIETIVRFDTPETHEVYNAEADVLDRAAAAIDTIEMQPGSPPIDGALLRRLAGRVRYMHEHVEEVDLTGPTLTAEEAPQ